MGLTPSEIAALLEQDKKANLSVRDRYPIPVQNGPIVYHDKHERCMSRRCGSPSHWAFEGMRLCVPHLVQKVNEAWQQRLSQ